MNIYYNIKYQINLAAVTLMIFTRIPLPASRVKFEPDLLAKIHHFIPLAGLLAAAAQALVYLLVHLFYSHTVAVLVSVVFGLLVTGAFHEDGFADVCDSLGGNTISDKLAIMKDSRLGTYGAAGLFMVLAARIIFLNEISENDILPVLAAAGLLSRWSVLLLLYLLPYIGTTETFRPLYEGLSGFKLVIVTVFAAALSWFFLDGISFIWPVYTIAAVTGGYYFFKKNLGGVTGDAMGAMVVSAELAVFLSVLAGAN